MKKLVFILFFTTLLNTGSCNSAVISVVAWTGMQVPGGSSTNTRFTGFSNVAVNDAGTVAFNASVRELVTPPWVIPLAGNTVKTNTNSIVLKPIPAPGPAPKPTPLPVITNSWDGIWTIDGKGAGKQIARTGYDGYPFLMDAGGFGSLGAPLLNNSNLCAYLGSYSPGYIFWQPPLPGTPVTNFLSVYGGQGVWTSLNTPSAPAVFVGQTAPGYSNPTTNTDGTLSLVSSNGTVILSTPVTFTNWPAFSSIERIALPETGRLVFSATVSVTNYYYQPVPSNGMAMPLYVAIQPLLQHGFWGQDSNGILTGILREGDSLSVGGSNRTVTTLVPEAVTNSSGSPFLLSPGSVNPVNGDVAVNTAFDNGTQGIVIASTLTNNLSLAVTSGDTAPGGARGDFFLSFGKPAINASGHVAFRGIAGFVTPYPILYAVQTAASSAETPQPTNLPPAVSNLSPSYTNTWTGLWAEDASGQLRLITRIAPPVPDIGGFTSLENPLINSRHQVAFRGTFSRGARDPFSVFRSGSGVWTSQNLNTPAAWIGQTAPGYPANFTISVKSPYGWSTNMITFKSAPPLLSSIDRITFPDTGRLVVWATASVTNDVPRPPVPKGMVVTQEIRSSVLNQRGIWIQNAKGTMDLALREGMSVSINGTPKVISSLPLTYPTTPAGGQETLCSRSKGIVVTTATFTDGTQAILKITP